MRSILCHFGQEFAMSMGRQMNERETGHDRVAEKEAELMVSDGSRVETILDLARAKAAACGENLKTLADMVEMHCKKKWIMDSVELAVVVACLIYVANPLDAIPDATPILGCIDYAAIVNTTVDLIRANMTRFFNWKEQKQTLFEAGKDENCCEKCTAM